MNNTLLSNNVFEPCHHSSSLSFQAAKTIWGLRDEAHIILVTQLWPIAENNRALASDYKSLETAAASGLSVPRSTPEDNRGAVFDFLNALIDCDLDIDIVFYPLGFEERRLETLLEQSLNWQHKDCRHSTAQASLFVDHRCAEKDLLNIGEPYASPFSASEFIHQNQNGNDYSKDPLLDKHTISLSDFRNSVGGDNTGDPMEDEHELNMAFSFSDFSWDGYDLHERNIRDGSPGSSFSLPNEFGRIIQVAGYRVATGLAFHSTLPLLLVCTQGGCIRLYRINKAGSPFRRTFAIWKLKKLSKRLQECYKKSETKGALCVAWGNQTTFGVGFHEGLIQIFNYDDNHDSANGSPIKIHLEIEAHTGPVNDLVFYTCQGNQMIVTCGDDKRINIWDSSNVSHFWQLRHGASLNSLSLHEEETLVRLYSSDEHGNCLSMIIQDAVVAVKYIDQILGMPFQLKLSDDGNRLVACTTGVDPGIQHGNLVELDAKGAKGAVRRQYNVTAKKPKIKHIDICKNEYIALGDEEEHCVYVWRFDHSEVYTKIPIEYPIFPEFSIVKFNREGAVVGSKHVVIYTNADGKLLLPPKLDDSPEA